MDVRLSHVEGAGFYKITEFNQAPFVVQWLSNPILNECFLLLVLHYNDYWYVFPQNLFNEQVMTQGKYVKWSTAGLNSEFFFS